MDLVFAQPLYGLFLRRTANGGRRKYKFTALDVPGRIDDRAGAVIDSTVRVKLIHFANPASGRFQGSPTASDLPRCGLGSIHTKQKEQN
jgi:hypothetical protein